MRFPVSAGCLPTSLPAGPPSEPANEPGFGEQFQDAQDAQEGVPEKEDRTEPPAERVSVAPPQMRNSKQASARTPARAVEPENEEEVGDIVMAAICLQELQPPVTPIKFSLTPSQTTTCSSPDGLVNSSSPGDSARSAHGCQDEFRTDRLNSASGPMLPRDSS